MKAAIHHKSGMSHASSGPCAEYPSRVETACGMYLLADEVEVAEVTCPHCAALLTHGDVIRSCVQRGIANVADICREAGISEEQVYRAVAASRDMGWGSPVSRSRVSMTPASTPSRRTRTAGSGTGLTV